jgi:methylenetetrahydrofolate reductase (NADPH)
VTERSITEVTLRQATHLASVGHSVAELRHIMGRYTDVGTQDVLVLRG